MTKAGQYATELASVPNGEDNYCIIDRIMNESKDHTDVDPTDEHSDFLVKFDDGSIIDLSNGRESMSKAWGEAQQWKREFEDFSDSYRFDHPSLDVRNPHDRREISDAYGRLHTLAEGIRGCLAAGSSASVGASLNVYPGHDSIHTVNGDPIIYRAQAGRYPLTDETMLMLAEEALERLR
jgi:hypothetical protein